MDKPKERLALLYGFDRGNYTPVGAIRGTAFDVLSLSRLPAELTTQLKPVFGQIYGGEVGTFDPEEDGPLFLAIEREKGTVSFVSGDLEETTEWVKNKSGPEKPEYSIQEVHYRSNANGKSV